MTCAKCDRKATRRGLCHRCYEANRNRQKLYGRWESSRVPAEPVRAHIERLRESGIGSRRIEELSGVSRSVIQALINGRRKYGFQPSKTISKANADALLAVVAEPASGCRVDITGTTRRLQALVAIGYTQTHLCELIGVTPANATALFTAAKPHVLAATARTVADVYDAISMRPGPSQTARRRAQRLGWAPPLAWDDDDLDNPDAEPDTGQHQPIPFGEKYAELRDLGYRDDDIAARLGVKPESLERQLIRHGITA